MFYDAEDDAFVAVGTLDVRWPERPLAAGEDIGIEGLEGRHAEGAALFFIDDRPVEDDFIAFRLEIAMRFDDD